MSSFSCNLMILWTEIISAVSLFTGIWSFRRFLQTSSSRDTDENTGVLLKHSRLFLLINSVILISVFILLLYIFYIRSWIPAGNIKDMAVRIIFYILISGAPVLTQKYSVQQKVRKDIIIGFYSGAAAVISLIFFLLTDVQYHG